MLSDLSLSGAPVPRAKGREVRVEIIHLLEEGNAAPELQLRAYLSLARTPPLELISSENILRSLSLEDCIDFFPLLARKSCLIDGEIALGSVLMLLSRVRGAGIRPIASKLARAVQKCQAKSRSAELSEGTISNYLQVIELLSAIPEASSELRPSQAFLKLVKVGAAWATGAKGGRTELLALRMFLSAHKARRIDLQTLLAEDADFTKSFELLYENALVELDASARRGDVSDFEERARLLLLLPVRRKETSLKLENLYQQRGHFQELIQGTLADIRGVVGEGPDGRTVHMDVADRLESAQLASALLRAWAARQEGPKATEAFEELRSVLSGCFGIEMKGNAGDTDTYNSRLHEFANREPFATRVRLLHPWVECSSGRTVKVLIKALVKPER